jgi:hypothetical protein
MGFMGVLATVAQAGQGAAASTAPTNVSIATAASGGYDVSYLTDDTGGSFGSLTSDGSDIKLQNDVMIIHEVYSTEYGAGGGASSYIKCYLRATGATSYAMSAISLTSSLSNNCTLTGAGTGWGNNFTSQDGTGSTGIAYFNINHGGGRGGFTIPAVGDTFQISIVGSATNSVGTTNASTVTGDFEFE